MKTRIDINPRYGHLAEFIAMVPSRFAGEGETLFDARNTVKSIVAPDGTRLAIKRFGRLNLFRKLVYSSFWRAKSRRAYDNGMRFIGLGFSTPEPVACIEIYRHGLLDDCYFISLYSTATELFPRMVTAEHYDRALADRVAGLMAELHEHGAVHGDPNLKNILTAGDDRPLELIDTNRSYFRRHLSRRRCLRNLMRVTHRRDLITHVAERYAALRGFDSAQTVREVTAMLERFERNRRIRHRIKSWVTGRPVD